MPALEMQSDQFLYDLLPGINGMNTTVGEMRLPPVNARYINNMNLQNGGGLKSASGQALLATIPFPIQKVVTYKTPPGPLSLFLNKEEYFAIAAPFIYKIDIDNSLVTKMPLS